MRKFAHILANFYYIFTSQLNINPQSLRQFGIKLTDTLQQTSMLGFDPLKDLKNQGVLWSADHRPLR